MTQAMRPWTLLLILIFALFGLTACHHAIEESKKRLPVWKKEFLEGGESCGRENDAPAPAPAPANDGAPEL